MGVGREWRIWQANGQGYRSRTQTSQVGHNNLLKQRHGYKAVIKPIETKAWLPLPGTGRTEPLVVKVIGGA